MALAPMVAPIASDKSGGGESLSSKLARSLQEDRSRTLAAVAVGGTSGAAALGISGAACGTAAGGVVGALCGVPAAFFTLGLSIPAGAVLGGGVGLCAGATVGGTTGFLGGGAAGYGFSQAWQRPQQTRRGGAHLAAGGSAAAGGGGGDEAVAASVVTCVASISSSTTVEDVNDAENSPSSWSEAGPDEDPQLFGRVPLEDQWDDEVLEALRRQLAATLGASSESCDDAVATG